MGHGVGIFTEKELKSLTPRQRATLKKEAVQYLRLSPAIRKLISAEPKYLTHHRKVRQAARAKLGRRLKPK